MNNKLSIITINYNNLEGLKRTVESVINQTSKEFEYIVIDGGSNDGSGAYIESKSEHIDYWVSEPDKGIYNAMNKGIAKASGEYLLFLNSGDHLFSNNVVKDNIKNITDCDLVSFDAQVLGVGVDKLWQVPQKLHFSDLYSSSLAHPAVFIKNGLFNRVGLYDENFKIVSDWKFFILALFKYNCSFKKVDVIFSVFYLDGISSDVSNHQLLIEERSQVLNTDFIGYIDDINQLIELRTIVSNLRKSKKIGLLVKLGLLHKF